MGRGLSELQKTILRLAYQKHLKEGRQHPAVVILRVWVTPDIRAVALDTIRQLAPNAFVFTSWGDCQQGMSRLSARLIGLNDYDVIRHIQEQLRQAGYSVEWQRVDWEQPDATNQEIMEAYYGTHGPYTTAARVAVLRACTRLQQRGLATASHRDAGINLTPEGVQAAYLLLANKGYIITFVSQ